MLSLFEIPAFQKGDFSAIFSPMFKDSAAALELLMDLLHASSYAAMSMLPRDLLLLLNHLLMTYNSQRSLKILEHILEM